MTDQSQPSDNSLTVSDPEAEGVSLGIDRYRSRLAKLKSSELETCVSAAHRVLIRSVPLVAEAIKSWTHHSKRKAGRLHSVVPLIENMDPNLIAMLTCRTVLDGISVPRTINSLAMSVGRYLEDEQKFLHVRRNHKGWWRKYSKLAKKFPVDGGRAKYLKRVAKESHLSLPRWKPKQRCAVGLVCIEILRQTLGIVEVVTQSNGIKSTTYVRATDEFLKWLEKSHANAQLLHPVFLPMLKKPLDWNSVFIGGYRGSNLGRKALIKIRNRSYLTTANLRDMPVVYNAVNRIQSTGFAINNDVLDVVKHCWSNGLSIGDMPEREPKPIPEPLQDNASKDAKKAWWKMVSRIKFENECERSKKITVAKTLWVAEKYSKAPALYFPQECDFRGRVYPTPVFLNVQGADYSRSLLCFSTPVPMTQDGLSWLAIHGANCWGYDKVSYADRLEHIRTNHELIMAIGKDPLGNMEWSRADKPFSFLAFCIEWAKVNTEASPVTTLPVHLDGSNNGLQILSLLLKDPVGGLATNCLPCDAPRDIYADVADVLVSKLNASSNSFASRWLEIGIDRKTTKRIVMCVPYGLTRFSSHEYVRDWYLDKVMSSFGTKGIHPFSIDEVFNAIRFLTELLWESIDEIVQAAKECMDWLKTVAKVHVDSDMPIRWTAPNGFLIQQSYRKTNRVSVKTSVGSVIRQHRIVEETGSLSMARNTNGISPNCVHGLDASVLMFSVNSAADNGTESFSCIHDSVGVHCTHAGIMSSSIREAAISIFSQPVLEIMRSEMLSYLGSSCEDRLPKPPMIGTMDITALRNADYFFA